MKFLLIMILCCCARSFAEAQLPMDVHRFDTKTGLPSDRVFETLADSAGNLYIATNNGLCLFDGYRYLKNPDIKGAVKDLFYKNGAFYFYDSEAGLYRIHNILDSPSLIAKVNFSDSIPDNDHYEHIFVDSKNRIWCYGINQIKYFLPGHKTPVICSLGQQHFQQFQAISFAEPSKGMIWLITNQGIWIWQPKTNYFVRHPDARLARLRCTAAYYDGRSFVYLATDNQKLIRYDLRNKKIFEFPETPSTASFTKISTFKTAQNNFLVLSNAKEVYALNLATNTMKLWYRQPEGSIHQIFPDSKLSMLWLSTNKGLVQLRFFFDYFQEVYVPQASITPMRNIVYDRLGDLWLSNGTETVWQRSENGKIIAYKMPGIEVNSLSFSQDKQQLLAATSKGIYYFKQGQFQKLSISPSVDRASIVKAFLDGQKRLWILFQNNLQVFDWPTLIPQNGFFKMDKSFWAINKINDIAQDDNGTMWFAAWMPRSFGIAFYDSTSHVIKSLEASNQHNQFMGDYYNRVIVGKTNRLWFTGFGGWNQVNAETHKISKRFITAKYGVESSEVQGLAADSSGKIWFGTPEGLYVFDETNNQSFRLSKVDGLPTNDFTNGFRMLPNGKLALGVNNGLLLVNVKTMIASKHLHAPKLTAIKINGKPKICSNNKIQLSKNAADLYLYFSALNFAPDETVRYRYRYGEDTVWHDLNHFSELHFPRPEYGHYKIIIQAGDHLGHWQKKALVLSLEVPTPFTKSIWFILLLGGLAGLFVFGINQYLGRQHRIKKQMRLQLQEAKSAVLRNQMNPHFLFNTLNSINSYIIRHQTEDASDYLTMFSKLMRNILANSQQAFVSLQKELDTLKLYLELEGVRLNHSFDYSIRVEKNIDTEQVQIPPLIMQPFVENSIWHGLRTKKEEGNISIDIHKPIVDWLQIEIADNGIGRKAAAELKNSQKKSQSFGIDITLKHLKMLNAENEVLIKDLYDFSGKALGTKIIIRLKIENYD